jgi:putative mRNA 3-end processing factor
MKGNCINRHGVRKLQSMLISFTDKGLYCAQGNFYIDPWKPVETAVITHAHSDHARSGHRKYLCHHQSKSLLRSRLGENEYQSVGWNELVTRNGVHVSLHPAGHIIGSAQVRVEHKGEVWVISGDYKTTNDGISGEFEPVRCHTFITESTFGLPVYQWKPQEMIYDEMRDWVNLNQAQGFSSVFQAYSLGKSQRIIDALKSFEGKIFVHGAIWQIQQALLSDGWKFPKTERITDATSPTDLRGSIFISPSPIEETLVSKLIGPYRSASCSGWVLARRNRRWGKADKGFVLSDHADWNGLLSAVKATGAEKVFVTHGFQSVFSRYLNEIGISADEVKTNFGEEEE